MRHYEYVPVDDPIIDDESTIDRGFGPEFCISDKVGQLLTTAHYRNLLRRARLLMESAQHLGGDELEEALQDLADRAESVNQTDHELAVAREIREQHYIEGAFD